MFYHFYLWPINGQREKRQLSQVGWVKAAAPRAQRKGKRALCPAFPFPLLEFEHDTLQHLSWNKTCCFVKICWRQRQQVWKADLASHWGGKSIRTELDPNKRESWCDPGALKGSQRLVFLHSTMQRSATGSPGDPVCVRVGVMKSRLTSSKLKAILSYIKY